jgi:hypothetical protein
MHRFYTFNLNENSVYDGVYDEKSLDMLELLHAPGEKLSYH